MAVMVMIVVGSGRERGRDDRSSEKVGGFEVRNGGAEAEDGASQKETDGQHDDIVSPLPPCASLFILTAAWIIICLIREHLGLSLLVGALVTDLSLIKKWL